VKVTITRDAFKLKQTFTISRGSRDVAEVLTVRLSDGEHNGFGECYPYARYNESLDSVSEQINAMAGALAAGLEALRAMRLTVPCGTCKRNAATPQFGNLPVYLNPPQSLPRIPCRLQIPRRCAHQRPSITRDHC